MACRSWFPKITKRRKDSLTGGSPNLYNNKGSLCQLAFPRRGPLAGADLCYDADGVAFFGRKCVQATPNGNTILIVGRRCFHNIQLQNARICRTDSVTVYLVTLAVSNNGIYIRQRVVTGDLGFQQRCQ